MATRHEGTAKVVRDNFRAFHGCLVSLVFGAAIWAIAVFVCRALLQEFFG